MSSGPLEMTDALYAYFRAHACREPDILRRLREETQKMPEARMQISPEQGQFMCLIAELIGARKALEIGTFTGYSALWTVLGMGPEGRLVTLDRAPAYTATAERYWSEAGIAERIDLRLGEAHLTLTEMRAAGGDGSFDLAFIDADKTGYGDYFEHALALLRPGGLILVDNVLWGGAVADPEDDEPDTLALRVFNDRVLGDDRVSLSMIPLGDGLTLARKRG